MGDYGPASTDPRRGIVLSDEDAERLAIALVQARSASTPSGPILILLDDLIAAGKLQAAAVAFTAFANAYKPNADFVRGRVPAKILNKYWLKNCKIDPLTFMRWSKSEENADWSERIKQSLSYPMHFGTVVNAMRDGLLTAQSAKAPQS